MKKFKKLYIEITNVCNLSCSFCPKTRRKARRMSVEQFEYIAKQVHTMSHTFCLHVMGEPLSHPRIGEILRIANNYDMNVNITTNGTLLDGFSTEILPKSMCISLHSFAKNDVSFTLESYLNQVVNYVKAVDGKGSFTELRLWSMTRETLQDEDHLDYKTVHYLESQLGMEQDLVGMVLEFLDQKEENNKRRRYNMVIKDRLFLSMSKEFTWPDINKLESCGDITDGYCLALRNQVAILVDGTVVPCCLDSDGHLELGNIFENQLQDIIQSSKARRIFHGFTERKIAEDLCKTCGYMQMYSGNKT